VAIELLLSTRSPAASPGEEIKMAKKSVTKSKSPKKLQSKKLDKVNTLQIRARF
jgi:hypothetical protein